MLDIETFFDEKFRFSVKIQKSKFLSKINILVKSQNLSQKSKF